MSAESAPVPTGLGSRSPGRAATIRAPKSVVVRELDLGRAMDVAGVIPEIPDQILSTLGYRAKRNVHGERQRLVAGGAALDRVNATDFHVTRSQRRLRS